MLSFGFDLLNSTYQMTQHRSLRWLTLILSCGSTSNEASVLFFGHVVFDSDTTVDINVIKVSLFFNNMERAACDFSSLPML